MTTLVVGFPTTYVVDLFETEILTLDLSALFPRPLISFKWLLAGSVLEEKLLHSLCKLSFVQSKQICIAHWDVQ